MPARPAGVAGGGLLASCFSMCLCASASVRASPCPVMGRWRHSTCSPHLPYFTCPSPSSLHLTSPPAHPAAQAHVLLRGLWPVGRPHHRPGHRVLHLQPLHARPGAKRTSNGLLQLGRLGYRTGCRTPGLAAVRAAAKCSQTPFGGCRRFGSTALPSMAQCLLHVCCQRCMAKRRLTPSRYVFVWHPCRMWPTRAAPAPPPTSSSAWLWATSETGWLVAVF